ncbi:MAG: GNAT family N-acetyltransferase [Burkholderiales bacterium]|nr:GNAT family N-acetyltransferase [Burkholderiales bacterium]
MVASDSLARVKLSPADAAGGLLLSTASGWNQTLADWQLFIGHGEVTGLKDDAGTLVATAAALPYAGGQGWISMVLVRDDWRRRGLATQLLNDCVRALHARAVTPVLDATPDGAEVYRRIGFVEGFALARWQGQGVAGPTADARVRDAGPADADAIGALDREVTGLDRGFLLRDVLARPGTQALTLHDGTGFVLARGGVRAVQVGPLVAGNEDDALALLQAVMARVRGPVFLDVPDRWGRLAVWLQSHGFAPQRPFVRMALTAPGARLHAQAHDRQFVLAGPEFG